ncbi:replication factor C subunit 2/4 [Nematocida displodere]|uniref:Replication factor C subunit 2/4 n=1 Tax=Nematocida displodere TaxID=1805483 RepID=A0A177EC84_9MICR|nr:replication factor C subunit 2/4 [Nematocida displodere]
MELVWVEKYRPKEIEDIVGNEAIVDVFKIFSKEESMPHLILTGAPGIGKTTLIGCLISRIFKDDQKDPKDPKDQKKKDCVLEMNASDERGVEVVRTKIKAFLQKKLDHLRFLILDESDAMTPAAQQSMRRLLEKHTDARFIFICNDISKIADTIQSRCAILRFSPLSPTDTKRIIKRIAQAEGVTVDEPSADLIAETAEGDARQAINLLQTLASISKTVKIELTRKMSHIPPTSAVEQMLSKDRTLPQAIASLDALFEEGYSCEDVAKLVFKVGKDRSDLFLLEEASKLLLRISHSPAPIHFYALLHQYLSF